MPRSDTLVLGVLGGIASGKSFVARALAGAVGLVLDADALAHEELASPAGADLVRENLGPEFLDSAGLPDRAALARLAFDPERGPRARRALEGWIHPRVRARISARLAEARASGTPVCVLDVPLLLENDAQHGLARACDLLIFVDASEEVRDARASESRGWSPGEVARREKSQIPLAEKRRRADHVLDNNGTESELTKAVEALRRELGLP